MIAIVGNGTSLLDLKCGKVIDKHDIVIRINEWYYLIDKDITGLKVDIWATAFPVSANHQDCEVKKIWLTRQANWDINDKWHIPDWALDRIIYERPDADLSRLERAFTEIRGIGSPTTGDATIDIALKLYPKENINLFGFDFYEPNGYYYNSSLSIQLGTAHNEIASRIYWSKMIDTLPNLRRIRTKEDLNEVLHSYPCLSH